MTESILSIERVGESLRVLRDLSRARKLGGYDPYPFQRQAHRLRAGKWKEGQWEDYGETAKQMLMSAGNQNGKTEFGASNVAIHASGEYPLWWDGPDFTELLRRYPLIWCGGANNDRVRDIAQAALCGNPHDPSACFGTGWIPKDALVDRVLKQGVRNGYESITLKHKAGFLVTIAFKSYDAALLDWAGEPVALLWLDEEPPQVIYSQCLSRTIASKGHVVMTFTPEHGATEVVSQFMTNLKPGQCYMQVGWDDAKHPDGRSHLDESTKQQLLTSYMPHEREMRTRGIPVFGAGAVFPLSIETLLIDPIMIPDSWPTIGGMDFGSGGVNHPTAATWLAFNLESGSRANPWDSVRVYEFDEYKSAALEPAVHAQALKRRGVWIPFAWPHDGHRTTAYATEGIANGYRSMGVRMLHTHAVNESDGTNLIEPGIFEIYQLMVEGRWKIFRHLTDTINEQRNYHRDIKDNRIVDRNDDLMSSRRVAWMMRRHAIPAGQDESGPPPSVATGVEDYDPRGE